ncbi:MAG: hypothetical protein JWO56_202 [Acidobacteria bacterium]|nr:hypothetical protein [Acidobacteriota bacterium]
MRRFALLLLLTTPAFAARTTTPSSVPSRPLMVTSEDHSLGAADDCDHFHTQNSTSLPSEAHAEEERDVAIAGIGLVKVRASESGGISVRGWDRPVARLTVCKSAAALTDAQAQRALANVTVSIRNGEIVATGPDAEANGAWWVHMILRVPKRSNVDVASSNGGIAIRNMTGQVTARATNGGISLDGISGRIDAASENGPISLKLQRDRAVPSLDAQIADGEIVCNAKACAGGWTNDRKRLRIGSEAPMIRLSTGRAPIVIEQAR